MCLKTQFGCFFLITFLILGCSSNTKENNKDNKDTVAVSNKKTTEASPEISKDLLGIYEGDQIAYTMKNQFGDDMIVAGKKIKVPASNYKVIFKEKHEISIQQTSKEDESRYYYDGVYSISQDDNNYYELVCKVRDGKSSNLAYTMTINKKELSIHCVGHNEPDFDLVKNDVKRKENKEVKFEGILGTEFMYSGEWSIEIKVTAGALKGQELKAYISTCGLGMTDKYAIEHKGNVDLNGADEYFGRKVKGVLLASQGEFANLSESDDRIFEKVWRIKELNFK
jgi:uncharacterized protein YcfL